MKSNSSSMNKVPFFAQEEAPAPDVVEEVVSEEVLDDMSMEDEVELLVQQEMTKTKRMSNLRNGDGVEYAPWMGISETDENKIRSLMRDRTEARRKRQLEAQDVSGNLFRDSQAQELNPNGPNNLKGSVFSSTKGSFKSLQITR